MSTMTRLQVLGKLLMVSHARGYILKDVEKAKRELQACEDRLLANTRMLKVLQRKLEEFNNKDGITKPDYLPPSPKDDPVTRALVAD